MKKFLLSLVGLAVAVLVVLLAFAFWPTHTRGLQPAPEAQQAALIEKGRYLADAGDCTACHTAKGGQPFAGGLPIASPIGTLYSSNITPDKATGIGGYSLEDFDRAVRHGIAANGSSLYPAMPYPAYARVDDDDLQALYAYFMHGVAPVNAENRANAVPWPLSMRWPLAIWRKVFAPDPDVVAFKADGYKDADVARGAYLVQGLGHCGSCHTPRAVTLQEKALDESSPVYLSGGPVIDGWLAVNLRGNPADGLGSWSVDDIVATLRSARSETHAVLGGAMGDVVVHSTQHLNDRDLHAMAAYLKTLPADGRQVSSFTADPATAKALAAGQEGSRGAELYIDNCAACHRTNGQGDARVFPKIAGNSSVLSQDPVSMIRLVLAGSSLPATATAPSTLGMPGFAWRLSDDEVAQLLSFVRTSWGNQAPAVSAVQVKQIRDTLPQP
ncbi:mono/diheme cytochrome c family protein [Pseudomonas sp. BIGb0450]|jgi:mono/diheme cytochrome c family protein|uniref:cytochrome c n=1 Tax=unclassified Pseudomonas TaxID=196821 RepID=UPI00216A0C3A|nr:MULTISPECIES: cytochrome c [unclassified Pseudomonas]MCS3418454.1 mono/diheme cytochrome c family protein [Pseudomonas sp. BIGb0558]MCS3438053.1 mono/diheme cytochrome c family protein [Pseudomonas sp. BIGb0450]